MADADWSFLEGSSLAAAPRLLGCQLVRKLGQQRLVAKIVEVEAYDQTDPASHSHRGQTVRNAVMFGPAGRLYVYFTYGMHFCCNISTGAVGHGAGVLIRAVEPLEGQEQMARNRNGMIGHNLTNGPGKVCQALSVDRQLSGHDLREAPFQLALQPLLPLKQIVQTTRVGISKAADQPWRFYIKDNPYVSKRSAA